MIASAQSVTGRGLHVAHVKSGYDRIGGIESMLSQVLPALDAAGARATLVFIGDAPASDLSTRIAGDTAGVIRLPWGGLGMAPLSALRLSRLLGQIGADILHTHDMRANLLAALSRPLRREPWACHVHGWLGTTHSGRHRFYEAVDRRLVRLADRVVVGSYAAGEAVRRTGARDVVVAWNAVALNSPATPVAISEGRRSAGLPEDKLIVMTLGRLHRGKGQDLLIEALVSLPGDNWHAVLVGEGPDAAALRARCDRHGLGTAVTFTGYVENAIKLAALADIIVVPSRQESLPLTCLEAMMLAKPVIVAATGDLPRVVQDGESGLVVPVDDAAALRSALVRLLGDAPLRARIGAAGRAQTIANHSVDGLARRLIAMYSEMLAAPP